VLSSLFKPAMSSVLPPLVGDDEDLVKANSIWTRWRWCWGRLWAVSSFCSARRRPPSSSPPRPSSTCAFPRARPRSVRKLGRRKAGCRRRSRASVSCSGRTKACSPS
jgi:hypothetical protein